MGSNLTLPPSVKLRHLWPIEDQIELIRSDVTSHAPAPDDELDILEWARKHAAIVHPTRGHIGFEPYPYQARLLRDRSPRRLIVKARQIGFSQAMALEALYKALHTPYRTILFVSRNKELAVNMVGYCYNALYALRTVPELTKQNESEIGFENGSRIKSLPANRAAGRGFAASDVYLDEYAFQSYAAEIYRSVSPTISHGGQLTVCSSPDGRGNHFYQLWAGIDGGDWSRMRVPWQECPVYDDKWYERERPNYTSQQWASEFECDFVASGKAVFNHDDIEACVDGWMGLQGPQPGHEYVTFWDIGRRQDATVGVTLDVTGDDYQVVAFEREIGLPYPVIQQRIEQRHHAYAGPRVRGQTWVESNSAGDPVIENLTVQVEPFWTSQKSKTDAITALALAHEQRRLKHDIPQLTLECQMYQWNDANLIQDCVMAAAGAVHMAALRMVIGPGQFASGGVSRSGRVTW